MDRTRFVPICYCVSMQVVLLLIIFNIGGIIHPRSKCQAKSPSHTAAENFIPSVWYYEHIFEHPTAQLRILTEEDGTPPLRSQIPPREREITIVTGTSRDRLPAVESTAMTWGGPMSLAVHVLNEADIASVYEELRQLHARVEARGHCRLNIHLVKEDSHEENVKDLYPVNGMRNIAWRTATTPLIFLLDADFKPNPGMHEGLTKNETAYQEMVNKAKMEKQLFVVPAFELTKQAQQHFNASGHKSHTSFDTKAQVKGAWENGIIDCFHCGFSPICHEPTNFRKFFDPDTTTPYSIAYREGFEPYMIVAKDSTPMFDERFRGYGKNKISHIYSCVHGHEKQFQVLPNNFIIEIPHSPSDSRKSYWGKHENSSRNQLRIMGLYRRFKAEVSMQAKLLKERQKFLTYQKAAPENSS